MDPVFLDTSTARESYAELARKQADLSDFDCYACHEKDKPPPLRFDANQKLIMPKEHEDIVMGHGRHNRNNNCFNCHNETNLERFQTRDGRELKFADSTPFAAVATVRPIAIGKRARTAAPADIGIAARATFKRRDCVDCHDPAFAEIPTRASPRRGRIRCARSAQHQSPNETLICPLRIHAATVLNVRRRR